MVLGSDILSKINIDLCFSNNKIRERECAYKGYTPPIRDINFKVSSNCLKNEKIGMKKYGRANMFWNPHNTNVTS